MTTQASLIGSSAVTRELMDHLERVAPTDAPVLVRGATGVGKELVAREIHRLSGRETSGDFIAVNCSAIPNELLESELFGHEKGAFSGAVSSYQGRVRLADGGSLLLDEDGLFVRFGDLSQHLLGFHLLLDGLLGLFLLHLLKGFDHELTLFFDLLFGTDPL